MNPQFKQITHWLAVAATSVWAVALSPEGQALINKYPKLTIAYAGVTTILALYHSPKTQTPT